MEVRVKAARIGSRVACRQRDAFFGVEGRPVSADDWSPDGRFLLYHHDGGPELWALPLDGDRTPLLVVKSSARVDEPTFSPDGRWIAYNSLESGRDEVYLAPFPATGARWQVSSDGGVQPTWRRDGRELYFLAPDGTMMMVDARLGETPSLDPPQALFRTRIVPTSNTDRYAVSPDGSRFLIMNPVGDDAEAPPTVILNWPALLQER
jgi:Tol biopolymer transport system component